MFWVYVIFTCKHIIYCQIPRTILDIEKIPNILSDPSWIEAETVSIINISINKYSTLVVNIMYDMYDEYDMWGIKIKLKI